MNQTTDDSASLHFSEVSEEMRASYDAWIDRYAESLHGSSDTGASPKVVRSRSVSASSGLHGFFRGFLGTGAFFPHTRVRHRFRTPADTEALLFDWLAVGSDIYGAMQCFSKLDIDHAGRFAREIKVEPDRRSVTGRR
jgi:hypothetical protein